MTLQQWIRRAQRYLQMQQALPLIQWWLMLIALSYAVSLVVSRLFIFTYSMEVAASIATVFTVAIVIYGVIQRVTSEQAKQRLDAQFLHNELVTALAFSSKELGEVLQQQALTQAPHAYKRLEQQQPSAWRPRILFFTGLFVLIAVASVVFPSIPQQQAREIKLTTAITQQLQKDVAAVADKAADKKLEELAEKLADMKQLEDMLEQVMKDQKELALLQQQLQSMPEAEQQKLASVVASQKDLTEALQQVQTSLEQSELTLNPGVQAALTKQLVQANEAQQQSKQPAQNGAGDGAGNSASSGAGDGQGQGSGSGDGQGSGSGQGSGDRELGEQAPRLGEAGDTNVDGADFTPTEETKEARGNVLSTKGQARHYQQAIQESRQQFMESAERKQLPTELQKAVQFYFDAASK
ncbi:hypothetical protein BN1050_01229 [Metalysinibacillus saudimassiliensis]|uniref:Uncharacterized protein n=1 Tax=Metalysinibacillus saudimassiliensis TaxID=1461583 RepID=A0A078MCB6_9BACL|nr:hypothetical protein BN1050_01229 [Metalysinibacillus saudimassiliensis]